MEEPEAEVNPGGINRRHRFIDKKIFTDKCMSTVDNSLCLLPENFCKTELIQGK